MIAATTRAAVLAAVDGPVVADRVDEPVSLLFTIAGLLAVLGLLIGGLTVLYIRATKPRRTVDEVPEPPADGAVPVTEVETAPVPPHRRSPVLRLRAPKLLRTAGRR
ncbi:MAG: hypothetical protein AAGA99_25035 [Actinomycetota bacterium]